ncbi:MAG: hypothetical protein P8R54_14950 [Myxococcota bacterium]|nr:hypothetical protein [Myxococcota bacterium]
MGSGLIIAALLSGCRQETPVLTGIPAEALLERTASAAERRDQLSEDLPDIDTVPYALPDGVYIDVSRLTSRPFRDSRDEIGDQLGELISTRTLHDGITEMAFERAVIRLLDDHIFMLRVSLPEPMRRSESLQLLGFPLFVDRYLSFHREFRLNHTWDFRRIRLKREAARSEMITEIEAWKWIPGEHSQRR